MFQTINYIEPEAKVSSMNKIISIIGIVIIVLSLVSLVLYTTTVLASTESDSGTVSTNSSGTKSSYYVKIIPNTNTTNIKGIQSVITVIALITPTTQNQNFYLGLYIIFPDAEFQNFQSNSSIKIGDNVTANSGSSTADFQVSLKTSERSISIPLLTSGLSIGDPNYNREYYLGISSEQPFSFSYLAKATSNLIWFYLSIPLFIIGIIVVVFGLIKKDLGAVKPMKSRSWQEPTLGGNSSKGMSNPFKSSKSSNSGSTKSSSPSSSARPSTAVNCKKCGGVMPRNSQYCPHCYTRQ